MHGQWPQLGVCTPFLPCKAKITFTLKYYFCVNCCGCICKKKVVKGKGYIILVYSAQLLVFHDSTWTNLLNACRLISLWAECHKWESQRKRLILDETWVTAAERLQKHYFHWLEIKKDSKAVWNHIYRSVCTCVVLCVGLLVCFGFVYVFLCWPVTCQE